MKPIGRIIDYQTGWSWFQMDDTGDLEAGDVIRVTPYAEGETRRIGEATIMMRMGHALHFDTPPWQIIPALCERDFVFRAEDPDLSTVGG